MSKIEVHHHPDNKPSPQLDRLVAAVAAQFQAMPKAEKRELALKQATALKRVRKKSDTHSGS